MRKIFTAIAAVGLAGCAATSMREHASAICIAAGYEPKDADYPECIRENMRLARQQNLRRSLEAANPDHAPTNYYFDGKTYERDYDSSF